jgi:hypothetical protein
MTEWVRGPEFVRWLEARGADLSEISLGTTVARGIRRWRGGARARINAADEAAIAAGFHLAELPDELFIEEPICDGGPHVHSPKVKAACLRDFDRGVSPTLIAQRRGPRRQTIYKWARAR